MQQYKMYELVSKYAGMLYHSKLVSPLVETMEQV